MSATIIIIIFLLSFAVGVLLAIGFRRLIAADDRKIRRRQIENEMRQVAQDADDQQKIALKLLREYEK